MPKPTPEPKPKPTKDVRKSEGSLTDASGGIEVLAGETVVRERHWKMLTSTKSDDRLCAVLKVKDNRTGAKK